jgi:hypothetical protein
MVMRGIISEPGQILEELAASRKNGNAIGIWADSLGPGLYMCAVENIDEDEVEHDTVIVLKDRDANGAPLRARVLFLQEIEKVFPLKTMYGDSVAASARGNR